MGAGVNMIPQKRNKLVQSEILDGDGNGCLINCNLFLLHDPHSREITCLRLVIYVN